jgi:dCMP deaminase
VGGSDGLDWDMYGMKIAEAASFKSKDPSTRVGCCILDADQRVRSTGFNGAPRGVEFDDEDRDERLLWTIHAEQNAVILAAQDLRGSTLYSTLFPCSACAKVIIQAGIVRVVAPMNFPARWADDFVLSTRMFDQAGVEYEDPFCSRGICRHGESIGDICHSCYD